MIQWKPLLFATGLMLGTALTTRAQESEGVDFETALKKAGINNKYKMLLYQFKASAEDQKNYPPVRDFGRRDLREYGDLRNLRSGYWVYVRPHWYVWRDQTSENPPKRNWGPEQVEGEPNTKMAGDIATAWASQTQDGQNEWLLCEYEQVVVPSAVMVYQTFNPGAVYRVTAFKLDGTEVDVWKGKDPTPVGSGIGVSVFPLKVKFKTNRVRVYIKSRDVAGWNEIDAIGMRDKTKKVHWAKSVAASSIYGVTAANVPVPPPAVPNPNAVNEQVQELKAEVKRLKRDLAEMKIALEDIKRLLQNKNKNRDPEKDQ